MTRDTSYRVGRTEIHMVPRCGRRSRTEAGPNHTRLAQQPPAASQTTDTVHEPNTDLYGRLCYGAQNTPESSPYSAVRNQIGQPSFLPDFHITNGLSTQNAEGCAMAHDPLDVQSVPSSHPNLISDHSIPEPHQNLTDSLTCDDNTIFTQMPMQNSTLPRPYTLTELPHPLSTNDEPMCMLAHRTNAPTMLLDSRGPLAEQSSINEMINCLSHPLCLPHNQTVRQRRRRRRHRRRSRRHRSQHRHQINQPTDDDQQRKCCSCLSCKICLSTCLQFQKVLIFFASFGIICIITGIILGVLRSPGNSFFTLSLMFVGLGLILLVMVLVGWKCTPDDHEPCHMLFGLGVYATVGSRGRRRRERLYWLGGMLYPEFRNRRPPPSYTSAMQERRNELRRLSSQRIPRSPPPSYKSHTSVLDRAGIHIIFPRDEEFPNSNPPTYRINEPWARPSLSSFVESFSMQNDMSGEGVPIRDSVSSTQVLVEAEYTNHHDNSQPQYAAQTGVVNPSFESSSSTDQFCNDDAVFASNIPGDSVVEHRYSSGDTEAMQQPTEDCVILPTNTNQRNESVVINMDDSTSTM